MSDKGPSLIQKSDVGWTTSWMRDCLSFAVDRFVACLVCILLLVKLKALCPSVLVLLLLSALLVLLVVVVCCLGDVFLS